jgi:hypothetical protein
MATIVRDFDSYRLWYYSNDALFALIYCYKGTVFMGRISFFKERDTIAPNANLPNGVSIHFSASRFNDVITILKQERPLYLFLNPDTLSGAVGNTHLEWTGEEEIAEETKEAEETDYSP